MRKILPLLFLCSVLTYAHEAPTGPLLTKRLATLADNEQALILIRFTDKGDVARYRAARPSTIVSERSLRRRALVRPAGRLLDEEDFPVNRTYVDAVAPRVSALRHVLKWFNAVSAMATKDQIQQIRALPFVAEVELVGRWRKNGTEDNITPLPKSTAQPFSITDTNRYNYGASLTQVSQIDVPAVHNLGIIGQGVVVGVFDNGVRNPYHQAFDSMKIIATYDFVDHKVSVVPNNTSTAFGSHGVNTLSTIGGYRPGSLIGPAFGASFILARTENDSSETPIEEDNWAAAIQWADSIGVDVTSTSLGYLTFDAPYTSLTWQDMNGSTALITNAADRAVGLGICVVNAAGNEGAGDGSHNTLIAPADGDSVITAGAVLSSGTRASFSSIGPTTDNPPRLKPDIMAMGVSVIVASSTDTVTYGGASGTSFACPLSAGVAALIRCANPTLTPIQVREAMRQTASRHLTPDNYYGWGILDAMSAINYYGITSLGKIRGTVFNDHNANGVLDAGDQGIAGVLVRCTGSLAESTYTDVGGAFVLDSLPIGSYTITETVPPGYFSSAPVSGSYTAALLFHADTSGFLFGNYQSTGAMHGVVFNDSNNNAAVDGGEPGVSHWTVHASGPMNLSVQTDSTGAFGFTGILPGTYTVSESLQTGWAQTLPANNQPRTVLVTSDHDTTGILFGVANLPAFTYPLAQGWNLLSLPQVPANDSVQSVYPGIPGPAFSYNGSYQPLFSLQNGIGYWLRTSNSGAATINGVVRTGDTIALQTGWNLIGSLSYPVAALTVVDSGGIIESPYFGYNSSYVHADTIQPGYGYWVKALADGAISMSAFPPQATKIVHAIESPVSDELLITDASGRKQVLQVAATGSLPRPEAWYELPPVPPAGGFDVRFTRGTSAISLATAQPTSAKISISSANYPLTIERKTMAGAAQLSLVIDGHTMPLHPGARITLERPAGSVGVASGGVDLPRVFALAQNFPNPFNPSTLISYQLPVAAKVHLIVVDVLGREMATLVDGQEEAGYKSVTFDASAFPSGVYFYRLTAGTYSETRKMLLLR